nr:carboxymuconolactone decarboxylase family protein [Streptomyces sp. DSM 41633]
MTDVRDRGMRVLQEMVPHLPSTVVEPDGSFGDELMGICVDNVFCRLWSREVLSRRDRSLVTVSVLAALYRSEQLGYHLGVALDNGLSVEELSEAITHLAF